jgi:hypothetical protein
MHIAFLWVVQGSYVFSGKNGDVDLLLLKSESLARGRWCYLTEVDGDGAGVYWWEFEMFFYRGMWQEKSGAISDSNWKAVANGANGCVVSCLGSASASAAKNLKGVPNEGWWFGATQEATRREKGPVGHLIQRYVISSSTN